VLATSRPEEALAVSRAHDGPIHLLLTDVVMPGRSGPALAEELTHERPDMRVLFVSGYASAGAVGHGHVPRGAAFLEKPFTANSLRERVRQVLDQAKEER
jgi:DNA-binding NtrC family response regulator